MWQKVKDWCYNSLTVAWAYIQIAAGFIMLGFSQLGDLVNDPGVKEAVGKLGIPAYVSLGLAIVGCLTLAARLRTIVAPPEVKSNIVDDSITPKTDDA